MELGKSWDIYNHLYGLGFYMGQHAGPTVESQGQIVLAPQKAVDGANPKFPPTHPKTGVGDKPILFSRNICINLYVFIRDYLC